MGNRGCSRIDDVQEAEIFDVTLYLIYGYMHDYIALLLIPTSIIELIIKFYSESQNSQIMYIESTLNIKKPPLMRIASLNNNKYFVSNIQPLSQSYDKKHYHSIENRTAICYVEDFQIPQNMLSSYNDKLDRNKSYDIVFTVGTNSVADKTSIAYIIDTDDLMNVYWWKLPDSTSYNECSFTTYAAKHGLIRIGREFEILQFNELEQDTQNEWKWKQIIYDLETKRTWLRAAMITDDHLFCNGGEVLNGINRHGSRKCDVYDFNSKEWSKSADMNEGRACHGIYFEKSIERVYVGGGYIIGSSYIPTKTFECYDINKNKWMLLCETNGEHKFNPIIWAQNENIINIASCYYSMFETMDLRENKWRIYKQDNKLFQTLFKVEHNGYGRLCVM